MSSLKGYENIFVVQRDKQKGCVISSIEWMLRYLKIRGIDAEEFQEKYDKKDGKFDEMFRRVMTDYLDINITNQKFTKEEGKRKIDFIKEKISKGIPIAISIANAFDRNDGAGWHIMPVVEIDEENLITLDLAKDIKGQQKTSYKLSDIKLRHNEWDGGEDVTFCSLKIEDKK